MFEGVANDEVMRDVMILRNVVTQITAVLKAVKPAREPLQSLYRGSARLCCESVHDAAYAYVNKVVAEHGLGGSVLDLGGRDVNGSVRELFNASRYVTVDIAPAPSVDVVADAADLDLGETFDVVISTECFEHTRADPKSSLPRTGISAPVGCSSRRWPARADHRTARRGNQHLRLASGTATSGDQMNSLAGL